MKRNVWMVLSAACFLTAALLFSARVRAEDERLASVIAPQVLRFHILANSNRKEDHRSYIWRTVLGARSLLYVGGQRGQPD